MTRGRGGAGYPPKLMTSFMNSPLSYSGILLHDQSSLITVTSTTYFNHPSIRKPQISTLKPKEKNRYYFSCFLSALKLSAQCSRQADSQTLLNLTEVARRKFLSLTRSGVALRAADLGLSGQDAFSARTFGHFPASLFLPLALSSNWIFILIQLLQIPTKWWFFVIDRGSQLTGNDDFSSLTWDPNWLEVIIFRHWQRIPTDWKWSFFATERVSQLTGSISPDP